jgi:hypothetical protein
MKKLLGIGGVLLAAVVSPGVPAASFYVDASRPVSGNGKSWETAFRRIQEAIEVASNGDTITVAPGMYAENVRFGGKNLAVTSVDPPDTTVVTNTIITAAGGGAAVTFSGMESELCVLAGFTIQSGEVYEGGGICGGTTDYHTHATIRSNVIAENSAYNGGGIALCDGIIRGNVIRGNTAVWDGGGLYECDGPIEDNTIIDNSAGDFGGGVDRCRGLLVGNEIEGNVGTYGGGVSRCYGPLRNNLVCQNFGEGIYWCESAIENNTISRNSGTGLVHCDGMILNCILWGNAGSSQLTECSVPEYSCIQGWGELGEGNMDLYPYFVDSVNGDYHLSSWSPCIDAGDPSSPCSEEPSPNGDRINMGAYGNTEVATSKSPDTDSDGLPDDWENAFFGGLEQGSAGDFDSDLILNIQEYYAGSNPTESPPMRYVDKAVQASGDGTSWETAFKTIQEGINGAMKGQTIIVAQGTYLGSIRFNGKSVRLTSTNPFDPAVVAATIIAAKKGGRVVTFSGDETDACTLAGFTIQNGTAAEGAGICGGGSDKHTHAVIRFNRIVGNVATGQIAGGGGIAYCDGRIEYNTFLGNSSEGDGGAIFDCDSVIQHNTITENTSNRWGGGLSQCDGSIRYNVVRGNTALYGGGIAACDGEIRDNSLFGNTATAGGGLLLCNGTILGNDIRGNDGGDVGGGLYNCDAAIQNNVICQNTAIWGAGMALCDGGIQNNTIVENSALWYGGGLGECTGDIQNCILWRNHPGGDGGEIYQSSTPSYCCIQQWTGSGKGNISIDPRFVDPAGPDNNPGTYEDNDYRLLPSSPCIDAGNNLDGLPLTDLAGHPRILFGRISPRVDLGAYEYCVNRIEMNATGEIIIMWSCLPEKTYTVYSSGDLITWQIEDDQVSSAGNTLTTWSDPSLTIPQPGNRKKCYRIKINP